MKRILILLLLLAITACSNAPITPQATVKLPPPTATVIPTPTKTPIPTLATISLKDIGVTEPDMIKTFDGLEKLVHKETDGRYSIMVDNTKYFLQGGWNLHAELNNKFAPATFDAIDEKGNQAVIIWNSDGVDINSPLSIDIENPTDFSDDNKLTTLQKYLLQNPDPFTERSKGLPLQLESTENGKVIYLRSDYFGNQSKSSDVWLRYEAPNEKMYYVNPINLNDVKDRKVIMCAYGQNATKGKGERGLLNKSLKYPNQVIWPILKVEEKFLKNFILRPLPGNDYGDLFVLLNFQRTQIDDLKLEGFDNYTLGEIIAQVESQPPPYEGYLRFYDKDWPFPDGIQEVVIPCDPNRVMSP